MTNCYYVPGTLSTALYRTDADGGLIWVDPPSLVLGQFGCMRLNPDGTGPGPPDGLPLTAGEPLVDYNGAAVKALVSGLGAAGYEVVPFGWDWRYHFFAAGDRLATKIRDEVTVADPCSIVAHSAGGLVARAAWTTLNLAGEGGLIRRIVTLGTPHYGTYYPVVVWSGGPEDVYQLVTLATSVGGAIFAAAGGRLGRLWDNVGVANLTTTWPLLYDLLPVIGAPESAGDPARGKVFARSSWAFAVRPSQLHLDFSKDVVGPWLLDPGTMPPSWVLTTFGGREQSTPNVLARPERLGLSDCYTSTLAGDGVVPLASSLVAGSATYTAPWGHIDLPTLAAESGWLVDAVLAIRPPFSPPPPAGSLAMPDTLQLTGPPLANFVGPGAGQRICGVRPCPC
jgi:hypothetical protein